jgi:signal transduction histidine kinase
MERLYADMRVHTLTGLRIWLLAIIFIVAGMYAALSHYLRPLKDLHEGARRLAERDLLVRIPVRDRDELGHAAEQFNAMAAELDSFYGELAKKVQAATGELETANASLREKNSQLETLNSRLREIDRRKTEVISIVSHDLRTPLTSIIGFSDTLLNKDFNFSEADRNRYIGIIKNEAYRLARLISDFLVVTKIEEGVFRLVKAPADLGALLAEAVSTLNLSPKSLKLKLLLPEHTVTAAADADKLLQVVHNLTGNAIKYSPAGGTLTVSLAEKEGAVRVAVADNGPGIPDDEKARVFEKFYRRDDAVARKMPGSGLGLAIAKAIVELHGGRIAVRDAEGGGSEFYFELPRQ